MAEEMNYYGGAKRSGSVPRIRDLSTSFIRRTGAAFSEGAEKYERDLMPYEKNWTRGDLNFALDVLDHALSHLLAYKDEVLRELNTGIPTGTEEDHLGHLGANLTMLAHFEEVGYWNAARWEEVPPEETEAPTPAPESKESYVDKLSNKILAAFNLKREEN